MRGFCPAVCAETLAAARMQLARSFMPLLCLSEQWTERKTRTGFRNFMIFEFNKNFSSIILMSVELLRYLYFENRKNTELKLEFIIFLLGRVNRSTVP